MCGIAGWIAPAREGLDETALTAMLRAIAHRGPDDEDFVRRPAGGACEVFLGHRRLAIIDLAGARQPMCDDRAGLALVFNGEIYNFRELRQELQHFGHVFRLDSDTEVLLRAYQQWGENVVDHLRGAFAFAVWDGPREQLFLARDRFGEKPLYCYEADGGLFFASEIKALLRLPNCRATTDLDAVWDCLAYRYVPAPRTLFSGIRKLLPGTVATWRRGRLTERRYWTSPDNERPPAAGYAGAAPAAEFLARLDRAVESQMVSDVPFGAFLSGGIDSSMIVALMSRHCGQVNTFSVGFAEGGYSELGHAAEVARQFGTTHHELTIASADVIDELPKLIAFRDAPVSEPSDVAIYRLACRAAQDVKMVLTGEGSDELLGGYPKHVFERFAAPWHWLPGGLRRGIVAPLVRALPYRFRRAKTALANLNIENEPERFARWFGALDHRERARLSVLRPASPGGHALVARPDNTPLRRILYFDQTSWLPDNLLERGDRMSMAASIEARVPFLDHRLAEWVSALPDKYRVRGLSTKWILREAAKTLLPDSISKRPKVGFRVPVNVWFQGELRDYLLDHLQGSNSQTRAWYAPRELDRLLAEHIAGRQNHEKLLWSLLNLEIWHRQYAGA